jgi:RHS repeat-associated protein
LREIEERNGNGSLVQQYVYGVYVDEPLVLDRNLTGDDTATGPGDQRLFYHQNTLASTHALTDSAGKTIEAYQYDAYGRQTVFTPGGSGSVGFGGEDAVSSGGTSSVKNPFLFTGRRVDSETNLYYYRSRYMSPEQGRFIHRDALGPFGDGINLGNSYAYGGNLPATRVDPSGLYVHNSVANFVSDLGEGAGNLATDLGEGLIDTGVGLGELGYDIVSGNYSDIPADVLDVIGLTYEWAGSVVSDYVWRPYIGPALAGANQIIGSVLRQIPFIGPHLQKLWSVGGDFWKRFPPFDLLYARPLNQAERKAARSVFGNNLDLSKIRIAESLVLGILTGARTPWNVIYYDVITDKDRIFIHELTHVWQTQHGVPFSSKLWNAGGLYDYGGPAGLQAALSARKNFLTGFNTEQQGDILQDYYNCFVKASDGGPATPNCKTRSGGHNITGLEMLYMNFVNFVKTY